MNGKPFVDTNVLVYAHDHSAGPKHDAARRLVEELWESGGAVLSTQVLQELCVSLQRKAAQPPSAAKLREILEAYLGWDVIVNTPGSIIRALETAERFQVSFWDALILDAAETRGASVLYSEDFIAGRTYGSVVVQNPFV